MDVLSSPPTSSCHLVSFNSWRPVNAKIYYHEYQEEKNHQQQNSPVFIPFVKPAARSSVGVKQLSPILQTLHLCDIKMTCCISVTKENLSRINIRFQFSFEQCIALCIVQPLTLNTSV